ncbi:MAG: type II toxin-antitoxin system Phd/YefM family antitoxin [Cellvibrionaceae bacterium]
MTIHTITSREFNHDVGGAKARATAGPVVITDRGKPRFVLLSIDEYEQITASTKSIIDLLSMPENKIIFDPAPIKKSIFKNAELD